MYFFISEYVAMTVSGVPIWNPFQEESNDVSAKELTSCESGPHFKGAYHYRQLFRCVLSGQPNELVGVALDGFPIYGPIGHNGDLITNKDLDICHGRRVNGRYQYHVTNKYPYVVSCFRSRPVSYSNASGGLKNCYAYCGGGVLDSDTTCTHPIYIKDPTQDKHLTSQLVNFTEENEKFTTKEAQTHGSEMYTSSPVQMSESYITPLLGDNISSRVDASSRDPGKIQQSTNITNISQTLVNLKPTFNVYTTLVRKK